MKRFIVCVALVLCLALLVPGMAFGYSSDKTVSGSNWTGRQVFYYSSYNSGHWKITSQYGRLASNTAAYLKFTLDQYDISSGTWVGGVQWVVTGKSTAISSTWYPNHLLDKGDTKVQAIFYRNYLFPYAYTKLGAIVVPL